MTFEVKKIPEKGGKLILYRPLIYLARSFYTDETRR
jgi:hypothetical protein